MDLLIIEAYKPKKPVSEMNEQEYAEHQGKVKAARAAGQKWNRQHPVRIKHVVEHWNQATPEEKESGMNWYADAHHVTRAVAHDTGHDMHTAAGMMSNYSPQTPWHTNMINAARVLRTRVPQGGKGEGIMATANQKHAAKRLLDGEHYDKVLSGPKTRAFAHLIEHGGNKDDNDPKVVIDRHALSVAAGARATDDAYGESRLGTKGRYAEVTNVYHKAAKQISKAEGRTVHPHQVQAATWLVRQRLNEAHDTDLVKKATDSSRSGKQANAAMTEYNKYMGEHHPSAVGLEPGTGYSRQTRPEDLNHKEDMAAEGKSTTKIASRVVGMDFDPRTASLQMLAAFADDYFAQHKVDPQHIVDKFLSATPEQHDAGMGWYSDAHHVSKALGDGDAAKAAGVVGVYSAGTPVAPNYHYASRALRHNAAIGGPKSSGLPHPMTEEDNDFYGHPNASATQAQQVRRILDGEHHSTVLRSPKVSNYAHLIEHGDDENPDHERVVVDRHAVSVATGHKISDGDFGKLGAGLSSRGSAKSRAQYGEDVNKHYHHVAEAYREAARRLRSMGHDVKAHQVQAVSWIAQKGQNDAADEEVLGSDTATSREKGNIRGRQKSQRGGVDSFETHYKNIHDNIHMPQHPDLHWGRGTREAMLDDLARLAYGEIKAPADVDTLQDEACPVCGETDLFSGGQCQVCQYIAPPKQFRDPDLTKARQMDLRKDVVDYQDQPLMDPSQLDENGEPVQPGADPNLQPGEDALDPQAQVDENGNPVDPNAPLDPDQLDENGNPIDPQQQTDDLAQVQPSAMAGESGLLDPNALPVDDPQLGGQQPQPVSNGTPGTPDDGVPDLVCPVCGFQVDASAPMSVDTQDKFAGPPADGTQAGDVCPNCGQGILMSPLDQQQAEEQVQQPVPAQ